MGDRTAANSDGSRALGCLVSASGPRSTAIGSALVTVGDYSTALGRAASAMHSGSFVYGDAQAMREENVLLRGWLERLEAAPKRLDNRQEN
jgi:hypothetical protein